jgi:hypothetical protein
MANPKNIPRLSLEYKKRTIGIEGNYLEVEFSYIMRDYWLGTIFEK